MDFLVYSGIFFNQWGLLKKQNIRVIPGFFINYFEQLQSSIKIIFIYFGNKLYFNVINSRELTNAGSTITYPKIACLDKLCNFISFFACFHLSPTETWIFQSVPKYTAVKRIYLRYVSWKVGLSYKPTDYYRKTIQSFLLLYISLLHIFSHKCLEYTYLNNLNTK